MGKGVNLTLLWFSKKVFSGKKIQDYHKVTCFLKALLKFIKLVPTCRKKQLKVIKGDQ